MEGTDVPVSVTRKQDASITAPRQAGSIRDGLVLARRNELGPELIHHDLALQVPDLDALGGGGAEPVPVGAEDQAVDDVPGLQAVEPLALVQVPEHGSSVLAATGAETSIRTDGDGVEVASVANQVGAELAVGQTPDLDELVPPGGDDQRNALGRGEPDAAHPLGVALLTDGVLALSEGVPQLDGLVAGAGDNLPVVGREGHGQNVLGVAHEAPGGLSGANLPEAEGSVPRTGQGKLPIGGDHHVGHKVGVAFEGAARERVRPGGGLAGKGPDEDGLVTGGRKDHVGVFRGGCDGCHPVRVAL